MLWMTTALAVELHTGSAWQLRETVHREDGVKDAWGVTGPGGPTVSWEGVHSRSPYQSTFCASGCEGASVSTAASLVLRWLPNAEEAWVEKPNGWFERSGTTGSARCELRVRWRGAARATGVGKCVDDGGFYEREADWIPVR